MSNAVQPDASWAALVAFLLVTSALIGALVTFVIARDERVRTAARLALFVLAVASAVLIAATVNS